MKDVSELCDDPHRDNDGKVKHATGTHHIERGHSHHEEHEERPIMHATDANSDTTLPVEKDSRPDFGREA